MAIRILIVEDDHSGEALLRRVIQSIAPEAQVIWTENAEHAALYLVQENTAGTPCDLVICDVFLAGKLTGIDLFRIYQEFQPFPPIVLTSGMTREAFLEKFRHDSFIPFFLSKPYRAEECRNLIARYLHGQAAA